MPSDTRISQILDRAAATLQEQLRLDVSAFADELSRITAEERDRACRALAEIETLKRVVAEERDRAEHERERAAEQAAEAAAADMRRQAEMQAQIAEIEDLGRRRLEEIQRASEVERAKAAKEAADAATADARRQADAQIAQIRENAQKQVDDIRAAAESQVAELRTTLQARLDEVTRAAAVQCEEARQAAYAEIEDARRRAAEQVASVERETQQQLAAIRQQAETEVEAARQRTQSEIEKAHAEIERVRAEAQAEIQAARAEMQAGIRAAREDAERIRSEAEASAQQAKAEAERVRSLSEATVQAVRTESQAAVQTARTEADTALQRVRGEAEISVRSARAEAEAAVQAARAEAEEVLIAQLAGVQAENEQKIAQAVERTRTDAHQAELAYTARLLDGIRRLDETRSLGEALDVLAECAARHVERAGVLIVKGDTLRVRRLAGFSAPAPATELDLASAGLAGAVIATGVAVSRAAVDPADPRASRQPALPAFARDAGTRHAVALPIAVGGRVVAVLYADASRTEALSAESRWPATLELLARHASRALEALTVEQAAGITLPRPAVRAGRTSVPGPVEHGGTGDHDAARRYARLLVSEIRMYHEPSVDAGRRSRDLRARLGGEIDRARRLYEERVPQTVRERSDYFEQELVRTLADGDRSLLG